MIFQFKFQTFQLLRTSNSINNKEISCIYGAKQDFLESSSRNMKKVVILQTYETGRNYKTKE